MPLFQLPQLVTQLVNARVALSRLGELLAANQQDLLKLRDPATKGNKLPLASHSRVYFLHEHPLLTTLKSPTPVDILA